MIRRHEFNSEWWGQDVGIVFDPSFFKQPPPAQFDLLKEFVWVEFAETCSRLPSRRALAEAGFFYADTQIRFRLDLRNAGLNRCSQQLEVQSADESAFGVDARDIRPFLHERFYAVPGATEPKVRERYSLWATRLVSQHPATCLRFTLNDVPQGWFLAEPEVNGLRLTLAMLSGAATVSGYDLYARAAAHFAELGHRLGFASFSTHNSNVLNIYSQLGARFLEPRECWIWTR